MTPVDHMKAIAEIISYVLGIGAAVVAAKTYASNSRRERAKWAVQLYEKFYESDQYKTMREALDCDPDEELVLQHVRQEGTEFTDYLNFFELVTFLTESKQLSQSDVLKLFQYYLHCLKRHKTVMKYVNDKDKGFEQLSGFLGKTEI